MFRLPFNISELKYKNFLQRPITVNPESTYASLKGRMFERWTDSVLGSARDNGYDENDLIQNPVYIIESLLRDENFVERDLRISTVTDTTHIIINGLNSSEDDFYNYAIYYNATTNHKTYISDYTGLSKTLVLASADTSAGSGDNIYITNIQGDYKISDTDFDLVGSSKSGSEGSRDGWLFARSFYEKNEINNLLSELAFESHCFLSESINPVTGINQFKLFAIESGSGDTWTNPAYIGGLEQVTASLTQLEQVFSQFRLKYFYDYGRKDFVKEIYIDKNGFPSTATVLNSTEQNLCLNAEKNYNISRLFEYSSMNIYDDATAERMLQKKIQWFTKQKLVVNYVTPIVGNSDYIKYEVGDQLKLNFSKGLPTGINNTSMFMITSKIITPLIGGGNITWEMIEL